MFCHLFTCGKHGNVCSFCTTNKMAFYTGVTLVKMQKYLSVQSNCILATKLEIVVVQCTHGGVTYPIWTFFCSCVVKKNTFQTIAICTEDSFWSGFISFFSLNNNFATGNKTKMLPFLRKLNVLICENLVWMCVSPHNVSRTYIVWTSCVLRST